MTQNNPPDARYCPSCGDELPDGYVTLYADDTMDRYRASFECPSCEYRGEVIREGGIGTMLPEDKYNDNSRVEPEPFDPPQL